MATMTAFGAELTALPTDGKEWFSNPLTWRFQSGEIVNPLPTGTASPCMRRHRSPPMSQSKRSSRRKGTEYRMGCRCGGDRSR